MTMIARRVAGLGVVAVLGCFAWLCGGAAAVDAAVVYRDSFERSKEGRHAVGGKVEASPHGTGWRAQPDNKRDKRDADGPLPFQGLVIELGKAGLHPEGGLKNGSLSMWVQRNDETEGEVLFSFTDSQYTSIASARIQWYGWPDGEGDAGAIGPGNGEISIQSHPDYPLWYKKVVKPGSRTTYDSTRFGWGQTIKQGEWFNVTFTWGQQSGIFVNGKSIGAIPRKEIAMDRVVADATYLLLGAVTTNDPFRLDFKATEPPEALPEIGSSTASLIDAVEIRDEVVTDFPQVYADSDAPAIAAVEHDAVAKAGFSGKLVEGNALDATLRGTPGATGTFDIAHFPGLERKIDLDWRGWGVYLEEKTFLEPGEVNLRDVEAYLVYAGTAPFDPAAPGMEPVARLDVKEQSYKLENLEIDTPYYTAVVAEMRDQTRRTVHASPMGLPLAESEPGVYTGAWTVGSQDRLARALVVGHLAVGAAASTMVGDPASAFTADPGLTIAVATEPNELPADEKSVSKITVTVTNANGDAVAGRTLKFLLATTSQYTGVVGGGAFTEAVGGSLKETFKGTTDLFGVMRATYLAGFAAKTAVIVARDMASNSTGAGYVKTFVQASASLELEPVVETMAMEAGYEITVTSSDEWLTADGKSQARITALVTLAGKPVEGHRVGFALSGGGSIRTVGEKTDRRGEARAVYTAGKKIGVALITATDETVGISGSVSIELRSDAPAKIKIKITPEKLPADGRSTADLLVLVTDINDNPNDNVEVEYRITTGGGSLRDEKGLTDRNGENTVEYRADRTPGTVTFGITVRSTVPTEEELTKARALALAVPDSRFF
jgi:hypothetical protein